MNCNKCGATESSDDPCPSCDRCASVLCKTCANLSSTEMRAVTMKNKRSLIFLCPDCLPVKDVLLDLATFRDSLLHHLVEKFSELANSLETGLLAAVQQSHQKITDEISTLRQSNKDLVRLFGNCPPTGTVSIQEESKVKKLQPNQTKTAPAYNKVTQISKEPDMNLKRQASVSAANMAVKQANTMNKYINLLNDNSVPEKFSPMNLPATGQEDDGFQKVVNKRGKMNTRKIPDTKFAIGNNSKQVGKITGAIRRKWIYVGRILGSEVSEDDIKDYLSDLKNCDKFEHISVEKLKTLGKNSAFCIGLPTEELYNKVFNVEYWSEGVSLREYDLRRSFLAQRVQMKNSQILVR